MNHYQRKLLNASEPLEALRDEQRFRGTFNQAAVDIVHLATDGRWLLDISEKQCRDATPVAYGGKPACSAGSTFASLQGL